MVQEKDEVRRKRVLYIGSAVPLDTAEGLEGVQKPLVERYPADDDNNIEGILSYLTITKGGIALQYDSDPNRILFFPISSLTLCAAVRCVTTTNATTGEKHVQFVSLSHPSAGGANSKRPAIFTTITRRTEGRKVLECHGFVCSCDKDALELVESTSFVDRLSKGKVNGAASLSSTTFETNTLRSNSASMANGSSASAAPDGTFPIHLVAGSTTASKRVAPEFYEPPPQHGYFYKTPDSQVKTYTVERVMEGESERLRAISPNAPSSLPRGPGSVHGGPPPHPQGFMTMPPPQGRHMIPVRVIPSHPGGARPRFFSPPPPMMRPMPMMMPPPPRHMMGGEPYVVMPPPPHMGFMEPPYIVKDSASTRRRSHSSSPSSSPGSPRVVNGEQNGTGAGGSTDASSRPHTPPTDYEKGPRVSRKEQFEQRQHLRPVNGDPRQFGTLPGPGMPMGYPYGMFVMYPPRHLGYPPPGMERARSVPPPMDRGMWKEGKKGGKSKKDKKKKKKSSAKHRAQGAPSDVSTDSVGYTSEVGPGGDYPRLPRDFRRFENQFKHERAFSKSLKEEGSKGPAPPENMGNAYSLNERMAKRGDTDFNLY